MSGIRPNSCSFTLQSRGGELKTLEWQSQRSSSNLEKAFDLICNYLSGRQQFTVLNGVKSDVLPMSMGIPHTPE